MELRKTMSMIMVMISLLIHGMQGDILIVNVPVSNLYMVPKKHSSRLAPPLTSLDNPNQLSQLLFGEQVLVHKSLIDDYDQTWLYVSALHQDIVVHKHGYQRKPCPGWICAEDVVKSTYDGQSNLIVNALQAPLLDADQSVIMMLSIGSRLLGVKISDDMWQIRMPDESVAYIRDNDVYHYTDQIEESSNQLRNQIMNHAKKFIGNHYSWGSRSAQSDSWNPSSVDCSGLVNISFLAVGLQVPKNSHSQYFYSYKLQHGYELQPGDLVFMAPQSAGRHWMSHVMLYAGDDMLIEAAGSAKKVQQISFFEKFGKSHDLLQAGDIVTQLATGKKYHIYFGTYLSDDTVIQELRQKMLRV